MEATNYRLDWRWKSDGHTGLPKTDWLDATSAEHAIGALRRRLAVEYADVRTELVVVSVYPETAPGPVESTRSLTRAAERSPTRT